MDAAQSVVLAITAMMIASLSEMVSSEPILLQCVLTVSILFDMMARSVICFPASAQSIPYLNLWKESFPTLRCNACPPGPICRLAGRCHSIETLWSVPKRETKNDDESILIGEHSRQTAWERWYAVRPMHRLHRSNLVVGVTFRIQVKRQDSHKIGIFLLPPPLFPDLFTINNKTGQQARNNP